jgi:hypothetical protein
MKRGVTFHGDDSLSEAISKALDSPTVLALIAANLVPLFGMLFLDWSLFPIMFIFWLESALIGSFNALKLLFKCTFKSFFLMVFFVVHFGGFTAIHLKIIFELFSPDKVEYLSLLPPAALMTDQIMLVWPAFLVFVVSHGISFVYNFIGKQEFLRMDPEKQMFAPYKRVMIMHVTIIFGALFIQYLGAPVLALVVLILFKIAIDAEAHQREHLGFV